MLAAGLVANLPCGLLRPVRSAAGEIVYEGDYEVFRNACYVILWGGNAAWNSVHSVKYIYEAQRRGAKIVVIDPVLTQMAAKADEYWQIKTSTDAPQLNLEITSS